MQPPPAPSNGIRLSPWEWCLVALVSACATQLAPLVSFGAGHDIVAAGYRMPHPLNEDYWLFAQLASQATTAADVVVLGDSFVWGPYVRSDATLAARLGESMPALDRGGRDLRVVNLGIQGLHPVAMAGLVEHFGDGLRDTAVLLHFNPLWLSSPRRDLQEAKEFRFNHPDLAPQFRPRLPCYRAELSQRLDRVVRRQIEFATWVRHLQLAHFEQQDVPRWTLAHPAESPLRALTSAPPGVDVEPTETPQPWTERDLVPQSPPWVRLEGSLQWAALRRTIDLLRSRDNRVMVLLGPLNEHALTARGRADYQVVRDGIVTWLEHSGVEYEAPAALPSHLYADLSHPVAAGYGQLAAFLRRSGAWQRLTSSP